MKFRGPMQQHLNMLEGTRFQVINHRKQDTNVSIKVTKILDATFCRRGRQGGSWVGSAEVSRNNRPAETVSLPDLLTWIDEGTLKEIQNDSLGG